MWKLSHYLVSSSAGRIQVNVIRCLAHSIRGNGEKRHETNYNNKQKNPSTSPVVKSSVPRIKPLAISSSPKKTGEKKWKSHRNEKKKGVVNYTDPGVRNRLKNDPISVSPFDADPEEFEDSNEFDVFKSDELYDTYQNDKVVMKEFIKLKIVEQKYFKTEPEEKLTHAEREHARYLHNKDPDMWNHQILAEHFRIDPETVRKILKSKWIPDKPKATRKESLPLDPENPVPPNFSQQDSLIPFKLSKKHVTLKEFQNKTGTLVREPPRIESTVCDTDKVSQELTSELFLQNIPKWATKKSDPKAKKEFTRRPGNQVNGNWFELIYAYM